MEIAINYLAVVAAAVAMMVLGMIWYGPLFGKKWMNLMGFTEESMKNMGLTPTQAMVGGAIMSLLTAWVLAHFTGIVTQLGFSGYALGFWVWLGFVMPTVAHGFLWEGKPFKVFLINMGYLLIGYLVMSAILTAWM